MKLVKSPRVCQNKVAAGIDGPLVVSTCQIWNRIDAFFWIINRPSGYICSSSKSESLSRITLKASPTSPLCLPSPSSAPLLRSALVPQHKRTRNKLFKSIMHHFLAGKTGIYHLFFSLQRFLFRKKHHQETQPGHSSRTVQSAYTSSVRVRNAGGGKT